MARVVGSEETLEFMVNCKTYPARCLPNTWRRSAPEGCDLMATSCSIPYPSGSSTRRSICARWDVIRVRAYRDTKDSRPESWHIEPGVAIERVEAITTDKRRWEWMNKTIYESAEAMEARGLTNGCVEIEPIELYGKSDPKEWTPSQMNVILQGDLFAPKEQMESLSDRVPWQFRLKYREKNTGRPDDGKVLAWSYYQGFRRARLGVARDEDALEVIADRVRGSIFNPEKTVFAILGTHSRFGHWMISSLYHVPTEVIARDERKGALLF